MIRGPQAWLDGAVGEGRREEAEGRGAVGVGLGSGRSSPVQAPGTFG